MDPISSSRHQTICSFFIGMGGGELEACPKLEECCVELELILALELEIEDVFELPDTPFVTGLPEFRHNPIDPPAIEL